MQPHFAAEVKAGLYRAPMHHRIDIEPRRALDRRSSTGRLRVHQVRLKPALRLFEMSPVWVSLTEPVTLNGPPNSFCSALSVRSHLSSMLEMSAPTDTLVSVGRMLKRSAWLVAQLCTCPVAFGSVRVSETPFCSVSEISSPTGTERLNVVPSLPCSCDGSTRVSIECLSQPSGASNPGAVMVAQATPLDWSGTAPASNWSGWNVTAGMEGLL